MPAFNELQIIRIIDDAGKVGVFIIYPQAKFMHNERLLLFRHARGQTQRMARVIRGDGHDSIIGSRQKP